MKILIAGYGFVGRAHEEILKNSHNIHIYDPALGYTEMLSNPDGAIVCVSTPQHESGACNINNVAEVVSNIDSDVPILIKSTISLEGWEYLKQLCPDHHLAFSPEFLRAKTAIEDLKETREIFLGGDDVAFWHTVFRFAFDDKHFATTKRPVEELILAKYFRNSFLATKVAFFNQVYDLCEATGLNYEKVIEVVGADDRIGYSHTFVTKERGFGGHCFPKDIAAITKTAKNNKIKLSILDEVVNYNNKIRKTIDKQ